FSGNISVDICAQVIHVDPRHPSELNPQVSPEIEHIILKALAKDSSARYQSASEMLADLRRPEDLARKADRMHSPGPALIRGVGARLPAGLSRPFSRKAAVTGGSCVVLLVLMLASWSTFVGRGAHQPSAGAGKYYEIGINALREGAYYQASK